MCQYQIIYFILSLILISNRTVIPFKAILMVYTMIAFMSSKILKNLPLELSLLKHSLKTTIKKALQYVFSTLSQIQRKGISSLLLIHFSHY